MSRLINDLFKRDEKYIACYKLIKILKQYTILKLESVFMKHCVPNKYLVDEDDLTILFTR